MGFLSWARLASFILTISRKDQIGSNNDVRNAQMAKIQRGMNLMVNSGFSGAYWRRSNSVASCMIFRTATILRAQRSRLDTQSPPFLRTPAGVQVFISTDYRTSVRYQPC